MSAGTATNWVRPLFDGRRVSDLSGISFTCRNPLFGATQFQGLHIGPEVLLTKVWVAADYSDSVPDSPKYAGYHPLEEVKDHERNKDKMLTEAEIARTTVEASNNALLVFPGMVHCEPHRHASWAEYQYVIDDYGDIFFEIFDDENILLDRVASNPVIALIGMDTLHYREHMGVTGNNNNNPDRESNLESSFDEDRSEVMEVSDVMIGWGMPETLRHIHPTYFAKCLTKAVQTKHMKRMDNPSNGVSIMGCLRPAFIDEESYLRRLFSGKDNDGYSSDWRDEAEREEEQMAAAYDLIDGEIMGFNSKGRESTGSTLYKLEIMTMELFSVYGNQSTINLQEFQDAEPDVLVHCAPNIIERFSEYRMKCNAAFKALCRKKKGLVVEGGSLVGIDSLGMDVRVFSGLETQTLRFSFNGRAITESAAKKKISRMLFPRNHRKNFQMQNDDIRDSESFENYVLGPWAR